ncbi:MAG: hypothetical protein DMD35_16105 [Gemmatimonadetes bacterium]|nr:MAG: hypothetical protein DMD35_16105 [Gemmatimonadota bacterium]
MWRRELQQRVPGTEVASTQTRSVGSRKAPRQVLAVAIDRAPSAARRIYSPYARGPNAMIRNDKELIVVGDRVLVKAEDGEERTKVGLYLPSTAIDSQAVRGGTIVATGPGQPMPACSFFARQQSRSRSRGTAIWWSRRRPSSRWCASSPNRLHQRGRQ